YEVIIRCIGTIVGRHISDLRRQYLCAVLASPSALAQINHDTGQDPVFTHSQTLPFWLLALRQTRSFSTACLPEISTRIKP
ncbi:hypothetical protein Q8G48_28180, partial [Klebsiella pneumoniae]|uniref:hypothetical protein n=1 Tax=Klebsiella pneumoniae TaxID=573 RepID=UPI003013BEAB